MKIRILGFIEIIKRFSKKTISLIILFKMLLIFSFTILEFKAELFKLKYSENLKCTYYSEKQINNFENNIIHAKIPDLMKKIYTKEVNIKNLTFLGKSRYAKIDSIDNFNEIKHNIGNLEEWESDWILPKKKEKLFVFGSSDTGNIFLIDNESNLWYNQHECTNWILFKLQI